MSNGARQKAVVAIVGRPNVGKSTLFNRLVGGRTALVEDRPGVTRDRHYGEADWLGREFILVDTGGFEPEAAQGSMGALVRAQTGLAIEEASVIIFLVDGRAGVTSEDSDIYDRLRKSGRPLVVAANKVDGASAEAAALSVYELGADQVILVSGEHGRNISELLDALLPHLPPPPERPRSIEPGDELLPEPRHPSSSHGDRVVVDEEMGAGHGAEGDEEGAAGGAGLVVQMPDRPIRVAVVGRPNAGKSSLINRLLGAERVVVFDEPGTTRDPIDTDFTWEGKPFTLIDTAGIRRRGKMTTAIEAFAVVKALAQIDRCDVAVTVIDGSIGPTEQDARLAGLVHDKWRAQILVITKWDLVREAAGKGAKGQAGLREAREKLDEEMARKLGFATYVPVVTLSSVSGEGVAALPAKILEIFTQARRRIPTGALNRLFESIQAHHPPPSDKGRQVKLYFMQQARVAPPTFVISTNAPERVHLSYQRYLVNQLREAFGFSGVPLRLAFRQR